MVSQAVGNRPGHVGLELAFGQVVEDGVRDILDRGAQMINRIQDQLKLAPLAPIDQPDKSVCYFNAGDVSIAKSNNNRN